MRSLTAVMAAALVLLTGTPAWAAGQAPVAVDDAVNIRSYAGVEHTVPALANDSDPDGDPLTYTAVTPATKGSATIQGGVLRYRPYLGNSGTDSFTYTATDGQGNTATGTVTATLWLDLPAPTGLAISNGSTSSATLSWPAATGAVQYQVFRNTVLVHTTSALTWTDTGLQADRQYGYRIAAVNGGGYGGEQSGAVYRQPQAGTPPLLTVTATADPTALSLVWSPQYGGRWNVYRDGALLTTTQAPSFTDTGLTTGRAYSYQVQTAAYATTTAVYPASELSPAVQGTPIVLSDIGRLFWDLGGTGGSLGPVTVPERAIPGGRQQDHLRGIILQQDGEAPRVVTSALATAYLGAGGASGDLGFPVADQESGLRNGGWGQLFEGGSIWGSYWTPTTVVWGLIEDWWAANGWEEGPLGYPADDLVELDDGAMQEFEDGAVYWSATTGLHGVSGSIHDAYAAGGGAASSLGFPTGDEVCGLLRGGCRQGLEGGTIHWSPATGAQITTGGILEAWERQGSQTGGLGYPTTGAHCGLLRGGCWQGFEGGYIHWSPATGAQITTGLILQAWGRQGSQTGRLGYPTAGATVFRGVARQTFEGGSISVNLASRRVTVSYR